MPGKEKLLRTRKRLLEDFEFWAKNCCKIRTKAGEVTPLVLNLPQKRYLKDCLTQLLTTGMIRSVILKGRQQGFSTFVSAFLYWHLSQHKGKKGVVIAHVKDSTQTLFDMYRRIHDNVPAAVKQATKYSSRRELNFKALDTALTCITAGGEGIGRGETLQCMHLSEVAFWPKTFAAENFNGLIKCLPNAPGSMCFAESTANGVTGEYANLWNGAVAGTNGFIPFFSAWYDTPEYRETPPAGFERTHEEEELAAKYPLDDAQLFWRRREIGKNGAELFRQEYPFTPEEAFITSGRPVFNLDALMAMKEKALPLHSTMAIDQGKVIEHPRGELKVYIPKDEAGEYYIGADVSVGVRNPEKSDWCVAQVLDGKKRQVAVWRGQVTPDEYARVLSALGFYYNMALVAPERNGHGLLVCVRLWKDLGYPNVFFDLKEGQMADKETLDIGFVTTVSSKPLIIDKLREAVREGSIEIHDQTTLQELFSFVVTDTGKMEGEQGCWDDCVMSLAICNHVHDGSWTPVEVTDDFYAQAI